MPEEPLTAGLNLADDIVKAAKPLIDDALAHKYEKEFDERIKQWQEIVLLPDGDDRADRMDHYLIRLCADSGTPIGGLGENISVPVSVVNALVLGNCNSILREQIISSLNYKQ